MDLEKKLALYRDMQVELALPLEQMKKLEKEIKDYVRETGETAEIDGARIRVTPPKKPRVYWDTKGLEGVLAIYPKLGKLRTEKMASPSIRIMVD
ncbi:MAG: hypothetical protein ACXADB_11590 [Candidatus Hermodarchaeia archaeon]|jgi:hypothetical protein